MARPGLLALGILGAIAVSGDKPKPGRPATKGKHHPRLRVVRSIAEVNEVAKWDGCLLGTLVVPGGLGLWRAAALAIVDEHPTTLFVVADMPESRAVLASLGLKWRIGVWDGPTGMEPAEARFVVEGKSLPTLAAGLRKAAEECPGPTPEPTTKPPKPDGPTVAEDGIELQLQPLPGMKIKNPDTAWGLPDVVHAIEDAFARWRQCADEYGHGDNVMRVGDISIAGGGPLAPHVSHQEGRDVDISIQGLGLPIGSLPCLLWAFLVDPLVSAVFLSYTKQHELWDELEGHDLAALRDELQYPLSSTLKGVRVTHEPGHSKHFHVRYRAGVAA